METVQVRLKPHAPRQGCVMRTYRNSAIGAFEAGVWHTVSREQADYLKTIRQQYCDETTPFAFEIYEEESQQKEVVTESLKFVDTLARRGKVNSENSEPITSGMVREEAPVQKEIVAASANPALGNHDEQAAIHGSRAENTSLDVPLPEQAKLNAENSEPVACGAVNEIGQEMETVQVRLKPHAPSQGCVMRTYWHSAGAFEAGVWHTVSREQAECLKTIRQRYSDETSPFAFEIREEESKQKEVVAVTASINSELGNHDEQAIIRGSRAGNTSLDAPLPGQGKLDAENPEPVACGAVNEIGQAESLPEKKAGSTCPSPELVANKPSLITTGVGHCISIRRDLIVSRLNAIDQENALPVFMRNSESVTRNVLRKKESRNEIITESLNSVHGNHDEQAVIQGSRDQKAPIGAPRPGLVKINAENSEPATCGAVNEIVQAESLSEKNAGSTCPSPGFVTNAPSMITCGIDHGHCMSIRQALVEINAPIVLTKTGLPNRYSSDRRRALQFMRATREQRLAMKSTAIANAKPFADSSVFVCSPLSFFAGAREINARAQGPPNTSRRSNIFAYY